MTTLEKIENLERKYMDEIWKLVSSEEFLIDLREAEQYIKAQYAELKKNYQVKNKIQLVIERLLAFHVHKSLEVIKVYPSPISSDIAFFTKDCLINIDAKTIDLDGNKGDDIYLQFNPNQISFKNKPLFARQIGSVKFKGIQFNPGLPDIEPKEGFPCLTFFVGVTYKDDEESFMISHIKLTCLPNGIIVKERFDNEIIENFKTYKYLGKKMALKMKEEYLPKAPEFEIPENWIPFKLNGDAGKVDAWLDLSLKHPLDNSRMAIWKILAKKYHICLGGSTARINHVRLNDRKDSSGNEWDGFRKLDIT